MSQQVVQDDVPVENIIEAEIAALMENVEKSTQTAENIYEPAKNDTIQERTVYEGKNFDPNFKKKTFPKENPVPKENTPERPGYKGKNFNPNYRSQPIKVHHNPKTYVGKNYDPNYKKKFNKPSSEYGYKGKNFDPNYHEKKKKFQEKQYNQEEKKTSESPYGYKGKNFDPDYYKKKSEK